jgi:hypothetical protein
MPSVIDTLVRSMRESSRVTFSLVKKDNVLPSVPLSIEKQEKGDSCFINTSRWHHGPQQVAVFSRTWPAARQAGQYMPHNAGIDAYFISVGERQPAQQVCIAKNSFPVSRASLRTFVRKLI